MITIRSLIILSLLNATSLSIYAQNSDDNKFTLQGKVIGQDTGIIRLSYRNRDNKLIQDTCYLTNGKFNFAGVVSEPTIATLSGKVKNRSIDDPNTVELFLEPAEMNITVQVDDFKHASVSGSKTQIQLNNLLEEEEPILKERKPLDDAWFEVINALQKDENNQILKSKADSIHIAFQPYSERLKGILYQFVAANPDSYVSPYLLIPYIAGLPLDSAKMFYNNFTERIKGSKYGRSVLSEVRRKTIAMPGDAAKGFVTTDVNGKQISLASFKDQHIVLLDFWASWCTPCRQGNPHLIELYKQYHPKGLEIIGIAMDDDNPKAWKEAIRKDNIGIWHHVLQGKDKEKAAERQVNKSDIGVQYGIQGIPVSILIDKSGQIVGRYEGDDNTELDKDLAELMM